MHWICMQVYNTNVINYTFKPLFTYINSLHSDLEKYKYNHWANHAMRHSTKESV